MFRLARVNYSTAYIFCEQSIVYRYKWTNKYFLFNNTYKSFLCLILIGSYQFLYLNQDKYYKIKTSKLIINSSILL